MFSFKQFVNEMTLVNRSQGEYPVGTKIKWASNPNKSLIQLLKDKGINTTGDMELTDSFDSVVGVGPHSIKVKIGNTKVKIQGTETALNGSFANLGGGKADTHKLTAVKEVASLVVFSYYQNKNKIASYEEVVQEMPKYGAIASLMTPKYYESAKVQLNSYKKMRHLTGNFIFELQGQKYSSMIYKKANALGLKGSIDNWNPGDVWAFESSFASSLSSELSNIKILTELNFFIRKMFLTGKMVSISLKASGTESTLQIINPIKYKNKTLDYDFTLSRILIASSVKSCFIETKSGYQFKANARAKENNPTLYIEGTFKQEDFSMGAIDATKWRDFTGGKVKNGTSFQYTDKDLDWSLAVFKKYSQYIVNSDPLTRVNFTDAEWTDTKKRRYISVASLLDFVMSNYDKTIKWSFFTAMKVSDSNSMYVKIK